MAPSVQRSGGVDGISREAAGGKFKSGAGDCNELAGACASQLSKDNNTATLDSKATNKPDMEDANRELLEWARANLQAG
eukprot:gene5887-7311_t